MSITRMSDLIEYFNDNADYVTRNNGIIKEVINVNLKFKKNEIQKLKNNERYMIFCELPYLKMFIDHLNFLKSEFDRHNSRRLFVQFDKDYFYKFEQDIMPCISNMHFLFIDNEYELIVNMRSSDLKILELDLATVLCFSELLELYLKKDLILNTLHVNINSLHMYQVDNEE